MSGISTTLSLSLRKVCCSTQRPPRIRHGVASSRWMRLNSPKRFQKFRSRCSITNVDVLYNDHIVTEDHVQRDNTLTTDYSVPIVHINSDFHETDSSTLITEDTYVDSLLTVLPVLTEEEQNALAATPAHPAGLYALYASCLAGNLVEQFWNFAWPSSIALLHPSLLPVAVLGFCAKVAIIGGGPLVGKLMDCFPRLPAYNFLNTIQAAAQLLSVMMMMRGISSPYTSTSASSLLLCPWFIVLVLAGAIERLSGIALGVAMERDWVVLLAGVNRPIALANANAILSRIDLLCEIAGASLFGILLSKYDPVTSLKFAANLIICSLPVTMVLTWLTNKLSTGVLDRPKCLQQCQKICSDEPLSPESDIIGLEAVKLGWKEYIEQPVLPASLACVLLYCNVALTSSSLMTTFLTQRGLSPSIVGGFSGLCAFMGVAATFVSAYLVKRLGMLKAGAAGLIFQASLLTVAVAVYWSGTISQSQHSPLLLFLALIVLSRLGHMSYDVIGAQILQTGIPSSKANLIGTTEVSVASIAESVMLGVAIIANDVSHFGFLAMLSLVSVVGAAWMFCRWLPTEEQRRLFSVHHGNVE